MDMTPRDLYFYHRGWIRRHTYDCWAVARSVLPFFQPSKGKGKPVTIEDLAGPLPDWDPDEL